VIWRTVAFLGHLHVTDNKNAAILIKTTAVDDMWLTYEHSEIPIATIVAVNANNEDIAMKFDYCA
jgi:hypothetical protein